ncbi:SprT family zinc-dependent metalloprotease [Loktanella sp. SALINAS62]|uniref:M48 family metallopeptidase n=1 Tax=Loktanella sp. SALINAS62 TaxID=2706124 RepID=UPI001B8CB99D|nr:SprT family zinc-dependent metalloprotease [Loktanella sp. SALINAS62]MBS1302544.1 M48 family metallopeptidase [Loktanella sp. SALINAS62]
MGRALRIGNPPIEVDLRRSAQARRLSLRVSRLDGKVTLTVPPRAPERQALDFLTEREDWLREHLRDIKPAIIVGPGTTLLIEGRQIAVLADDVRRMTLTDDSLLLPPGAGGPAVMAFLKTRARDRLAQASDRYAALIGRRYNKLTLRDTRSRWGSCTSTGGLMYSWRLIMAPPAVLNYVAAHEVAHLEQMNHSSAFWEIVARLDPDYARHRQWLRDNGDRLHAVRFGAS